LPRVERTVPDDALGRPHVRDGAVPASRPRARPPAGLVAAARRLAVSALRDLARAAGLDPEYTSWRGETTAASDEALLQALRSLAPDLDIAIEGPDDAPAAIERLERARWQEIVPPV